MKILLSTYACDPSAGGEFNNGWRYACNVSREREIWCMATSEGKSAIDSLLSKSELPGLHMVYVNTPEWLLRWKNKSPMLGIYFHYISWQYLAYKKAKQLSKEIEFDLVHHATWSSLQLGSFLWKLKKPMLFGPVGGGQTASPRYKKYFFGYWKFEVARDVISFCLLNIVRIASKALKHSQLVLVNNEETFELAKNYGARRIEYAPCTMLADQFLLDNPPKKNAGKSLRLLWVGRILPRKGLRLILEGFSKVNHNLPIELTIIGYGVLDQQLPLWLDELNLNDRVKVLGRLPMEEVRKAYASHDAFIYCSLRESLAAQFFEAMAFGLPLIVFDLHGAKTFIPKDVAIKIPFNEPETTISSIAKAIEKMYEFQDERVRMGERAYALARKFTWSNRIGIINMYYQQLMNVQERPIRASAPEHHYTVLSDS